MGAPASMTVPAGVIGVVRAATAAEGRTIVHGLIRAAVPAVELTMTVPDAVAIIGEFAGLVRETALGAGTVLDPLTCVACAGTLALSSHFASFGKIQQSRTRIPVPGAPSSAMREQSRS